MSALSALAGPLTSTWTTRGGVVVGGGIEMTPALSQGFFAAAAPTIPVASVAGLDTENVE